MNRTKRIRNLVDVNDQGTIAVAIARTEEFNPGTIQPRTVRFQGAVPVGHRTRRGDLILEFNIQDLGLRCFPRPGRPAPEITVLLTATTHQGQVIYGTEVIQPTGCP